MHAVIQISPIVISSSSMKGEDMNGRVHSSRGTMKKRWRK